MRCVPTDTNPNPILSSSVFRRKFITLWTKFKALPENIFGWERKKKTLEPLLKSHMSPIELQSDLRWDASGGIGGGLGIPLSVNVSLSLPLSLSLSLTHTNRNRNTHANFPYLSAGWNSSSVARAQPPDKQAAAKLSHYITGNEWTTPLWPNQGRKNTCSAGLGWPTTCREGWEFLQREGWRDGGGGRWGRGAPCVHTVCH